MAKDRAAADREAAEYWRRVARVDRSEVGLANSNARVLSDAAQREDQESSARQGNAQSSRKKTLAGSRRVFSSVSSSRRPHRHGRSAAQLLADQGRASGRG